MRLIFAFFAKYADILKDDTFSVVGGGFDAIKLAAFPNIIPFMSLVVRFRVDEAECGRNHEFQMSRVVGPNGDNLDIPQPEPMRFNSQFDPDVGFGTFMSVMTVIGFRFDGPGSYRFIFTSDGREVGELTLGVFQG